MPQAQVLSAAAGTLPDIVVRLDIAKILPAQATIETKLVSAEVHISGSF